MAPPFGAVETIASAGNGCPVGRGVSKSKSTHKGQWFEPPNDSHTSPSVNFSLNGRGDCLSPFRLSPSGAVTDVAPPTGCKPDKLSTPGPLSDVATRGSVLHEFSTPGPRSDMAPRGSEPNEATPFAASDVAAAVPPARPRSDVAPLPTWSAADARACDCLPLSTCSAADVAAPDWPPPGSSVADWRAPPRLTTPRLAEEGVAAAGCESPEFTGGSIAEAAVVVGGACAAFDMWGGVESGSAAKM
jgi:hypothetical protein